MKKTKEIPSGYPKGFWKRLHWETIGSWRDWAWLFAVACILATAALCWVGEYRFWQNVNKAVERIKGALGFEACANIELFS